MVLSLDSQVAANFSVLKHHKIDFIVNLVSSKSPNSFPLDFQYLNYDINDNANSQILLKTIQILESVGQELLAQKRVLVHCYKGISRAPTIAIAYLMKFYGMTFDDAFDCVKAKVPHAEPNAGFLIQLNNFGQVTQL